MIETIESMKAKALADASKKHREDGPRRVTGFYRFSTGSGPSVTCWAYAWFGKGFPDGVLAYYGWTGEGQTDHGKMVDDPKDGSSFKASRALAQLQFHDLCIERAATGHLMTIDEFHLLPKQTAEAAKASASK